MTAQEARRHGARYNGTLYGLKGRGLAPNRPVRFESMTEMDQAILLEHDPTVLEYYDHPFPIIASFPDGTQHQYIPDFLVVRTTGKTIIECKPDAFVDDEATRQQRTIGEAWAAATHHQFLLVTDKDLKTGPRLINVKLLWRYRLLRVPPSHLVRCLSYLDAHLEGVPLGKLAAQISEPEAPLDQACLIYNLLFHHKLEADLEQPLTVESLIKRSTNG